MTAYSSLARFYDSLTTDVPYEAFADFYEDIFKLYGLEVKTILDLACGTGTMTHLLAGRGYEMIGADASPDMLSVAAQKAGRAAVEPVFICQGMEELDLYGTVDAVVCTLDGINYLPPGDSLARAIHRVRLFLEPGGVFIFDINTPLKLRELDGEVFIDETDEIFCVWRAEFDETKNACLYGIDMFSKSKGALWERSSEEHIEYVHEPHELVEILNAGGFVEVRMFGELKMAEPSQEEQRVFIAARKR